MLVEILNMTFFRELWTGCGLRSCTIDTKREIVQRYKVNAKIGTLPILEQNGRKLEIDVVELLLFILNFKISAKYFVWHCRMQQQGWKTAMINKHKAKRLLFL